MALEYGFYNSINGDRKYGANDFSRIFDGMIRDGVFEHYGGAFMVTPGSSGLTVVIGTGKAWFEHTWNILDTPYTMTLEAASTIYPRIDAVVLETNAESRTNSFTIVKGTPAATPEKPALSSTQHPLAYVTVRVDASSIYGSDIEYVVGQTGTPFVDGLLNMVDITSAFQQWKAQFDNWFNNLVYVLDGDVAGHLQNQINQNGSRITVLESDSWKVGDIYQSIRAITDDRWRLANGDYITSTEYPEFFQVVDGVYNTADCTRPNTDLRGISGACICSYRNDLVWPNSFSQSKVTFGSVSGTVPTEFASITVPDTRIIGMWYYGNTWYWVDHRYVTVSGEAVYHMHLNYIQDGVVTTIPIGTHVGYQSDYDYWWYATYPDSAGNILVGMQSKYATHTAYNHRLYVVNLNTLAVTTVTAPDGRNCIITYNPEDDTIYYRSYEYDILVYALNTSTMTFTSKYTISQGNKNYLRQWHERYTIATIPSGSNYRYAIKRLSDGVDLLQDVSMPSTSMSGYRITGYDFGNTVYITYQTASAQPVVYLKIDLDTGVVTPIDAAAWPISDDATETLHSAGDCAFGATTYSNKTIQMQHLPAISASGYYSYVRVKP